MSASANMPNISLWDPPFCELDLGYRIYERHLSSMYLDYQYKFMIPGIDAWHLDPVLWTRWWQGVWHYCFPISLLYLCCTFIGQKLMKQRKPFQVDGLLFYWNVALAVFSLLGSIRVGEETIGVLLAFDYERTVCYSCHPSGVCPKWLWYFAMSKVVELGDTVFLVLKKRPVSFLHWFHHMSVIIFVWHSGTEHPAVGRYYMFVNYTVHAFMYTYYATKARFGHKIPKFVSIGITLGQIIQMVLGITLTYKVMQLKRAGIACQQSYTNLYFAILIYAVYFSLFVKFFVDAYINKRKHKKSN